MSKMYQTASESGGPTEAAEQVTHHRERLEGTWRSQPFLRSIGSCPPQVRLRRMTRLVASPHPLNLTAIVLPPTTSVRSHSRLRRKQDLTEPRNRVVLTCRNTGCREVCHPCESRPSAFGGLTGRNQGEVAIRSQTLCRW